MALYLLNRNDEIKPLFKALTYTFKNVFAGIRAYEQLGNHAFGNPGKVIAACIITIHNIGGKSLIIFCIHNVILNNISCKQGKYPVFSAMSSYLFIVKSELPLVIQAFLGKHDNTG